MKKLSIIIPFKNEGSQLIKTIKSFRKYSNTDLFDIICINDVSDDYYDYDEILQFDNVKLINNTERVGCAGNRDYGTKISETEFVFFCDAHMRIFEDIFTPLIKKLEFYKRTLICLQSKVIKIDNNGNTQINIEKAITLGVKVNLNTEDVNFGNYDWLIQNPNLIYPEDIQIPCVMGACYGISREYYLYLHGLNGLSQWGCDEQFLSAKVYREGGRVILLKNLEIAHFYAKVKNYSNTDWMVLYNKILYCYLICGEREFEKYWDFLSNNNFINVNQAFIIFKTILPSIRQEKQYLNLIFTKSYEYYKSINNGF